MIQAPEKEIDVRTRRNRGKDHRGVRLKFKEEELKSIHAIDWRFRVDRKKLQEFILFGGDQSLRQSVEFGCKRPPTSMTIGIVPGKQEKLS